MDFSTAAITLPGTQLCDHNTAELPIWVQATRRQSNKTAHQLWWGLELSWRAALSWLGLELSWRAALSWWGLELS